MPELPEVETTRRGLQPHLLGQRLTRVEVRNPRLRQPLPASLEDFLRGRELLEIGRRGKYLLFDFSERWLIAHLGMSGSLRVVAEDEPPGKHDHVDLVFGSRVLRYRDPRRFGLLLPQAGVVEQHPLLASLGIEPLSAAFDADWLFAATRERRTPIKLFLMDAHRIVGVGNIYANESLFRAGLSPFTPATCLRREECARLVEQVRATLAEAISAGGSTLRDFVGGDGRPGYFQQRYHVYDRAAAPCTRCATPLRREVQAQRATFYCPRCQRSGATRQA